MAYNNITGYLCGLLEEWDQARKPQEQILLECYQDYMRIPRDGDTKGTGIAKTQSSKPLFMGATRSKIRSATAKIIDSLFGNGVMPFDTSAKNPELEPYSDTIKTIITGQLEAMEFRPMMSAAVVSLATYGTTWIFGPFTRKATVSQVVMDSSMGIPQMVEMEYSYDEPYYELGNTLDIYPDPSARSMKSAQGIFWVSMYSPNQVLELDGQEGYKNVLEASRAPDSKGIEIGSDQASSMRGNTDYWYKDGRIKFVRYFGRVPASKLKDYGMDDIDGDSGDDISEGIEENKMVHVVVIMAGGLVLKVSKISENDGPMALRQCWENALDEMWGVGISENNFAMQKVVNAGFRMFTESKGLALNPVKAVDRSKFLPTEDFKQYPGKVYQFKPGLSPDEKTSAIIPFLTPDVSTGWIDLINMAGQFSDDDTGITKYTQGDDSSHLNKTASGISMIMSASSLPLKEVVQHCDRWIESIIESLIDWNLTFMEPSTVDILYGNEDAQRWAEIKRLGKASFVDWKATGTSSFMAKEVLTSKLQAFMGLAMGNPATAQLVDAKELLSQVWDAMEVGRKSPIKSDEQGPSPEVQGMQEQMQQMDQVIQSMKADLDSKQSQDALNIAKAEAERTKLMIEQERVAVDRYNAQTNRIKVEGELALKAQNDLTDSEREQFKAELAIRLEEMRQDHEAEMEAMRRAYEKEMETIRALSSMPVADSGIIMP